MRCISCSVRFTIIFHIVDTRKRKEKRKEWKKEKKSNKKGNLANVVNSTISLISSSHL